MIMHEALCEQLRENPWSDELGSDWEIFEDGDWTDEGKSESKRDVVKHLPTGEFYAVYYSRYGDHWQGYETSFEGATHVEPKQVKRIIYVEVKP